MATTRGFKFCAVPGCPSMAAPGRSCCAKHQAERQKRIDQHRGTAAERGYTSDWQQVQARQLEAMPTCERCGARATLVHHRVAISKGGARLDSANLESLCASCHATAHPERWQGMHAAREGRRVYPKRGKSDR